MFDAEDLSTALLHVFRRPNSSGGMEIWARRRLTVQFFLDCSHIRKSRRALPPGRWQVGPSEKIVSIRSVT